MFKNITEIKQANKMSGHHWFAPSEMRYFGTRIVTHHGVINGQYFITSEQHDDSPRLFTIRKALDDGRIETIGDFMGYATAKAAADVAKGL
jgi:hypothetical protein